MAGNLREQNMEVKEPGNQFVKLIPRFAFTAFLAVVFFVLFFGSYMGRQTDPLVLSCGLRQSAASACGIPSGCSAAGKRRIMR